MENKKPVKEFRAGQIKASVWKNEKQNNNNETVVYHSVKIEKSFKPKGEEDWKTTNSYSREDLAKVQLVAFKAFEWIYIDSKLDDQIDDNVPV